MKVAFSFIFSRKSLFEIKCLPCCPFSLWAYSSVKCHCDCRLGVFNLLIDDWIKFQSYDNDFDPIEANTNDHTNNSDNNNNNNKPYLDFALE